MLNSVNLIGRIAWIGELREVVGPSGSTNVLDVLVAVDRPFTKEVKAQREAAGKQTADFLAVSIWNGAATAFKQHKHVGDEICVSGRIESSERVNADGSKTRFTQIRGERIEWLRNKGDGTRTVTEQPDHTPQEAPAEVTAQAAPVAAAPAPTDDDIPF